MVGGLGRSLYFAESTLNGIDIGTIPDFDATIYANCLLSVDEDTIYSFGGHPVLNHFKIARYTIGDSQWEVIIKKVIYSLFKIYDFQELKFLLNSVLSDATAAAEW